MHLPTEWPLVTNITGKLNNSAQYYLILEVTKITRRQNIFKIEEWTGEKKVI